MQSKAMIAGMIPAVMKVTPAIAYRPNFFMASRFSHGRSLHAPTKWRARTMAEPDAKHGHGRGGAATVFQIEMSSVISA